MNGRLTTRQVARQTGKSLNRIQQLCSTGKITSEYAEKHGTNWWLLPSVVPFIKALPDGRGRPRKIVENKIPLT